MQNFVARWRYVVACAVVLSVLTAADAAVAAPVRTDADVRSRIAAAEREARDRTVPRIIRRIVKSLTDELIGPRP